MQTQVSSKRENLETYKSTSTPPHPLADKTINEVQNILNSLKTKYPDYDDFAYEYTFMSDNAGNRFAAYVLVGIKAG